MIVFQKIDTRKKSISMHHATKVPPKVKIDAILAKQLEGIVQDPEAFLDKMKSHLLRTTELINEFWFSRIFQERQACKKTLRISTNTQIIDNMCELIAENWIPKTKEMTSMSMEIQLLADSITVTISLANTFVYGHGGNTCTINIPHGRLNHITSTYLYLLSNHYQDVVDVHNKAHALWVNGGASVPRVSTNKLFSIDPFFDNNPFTARVQANGSSTTASSRLRRRGNLDSLYCNDISIKLKKVSLDVNDKMVLLLHGISYMGQFVDTQEAGHSLERLLISIYYSYEHLIAGDIKTSLISTIKQLANLHENQTCYRSVYNYIEQADVMDIDTSGDSLPLAADVAGIKLVITKGMKSCCAIDKCKTCTLIESITSVS